MDVSLIGKSASSGVDNHTLILFIRHLSSLIAPPCFTHSILSAFEESSASCISDMLKYVSDGQYLDAIRNAEKFILHVEVLFAAIDDLEYCFASKALKGTAAVSIERNIF